MLWRLSKYNLFKYLLKGTLNDNIRKYIIELSYNFSDGIAVELLVFQPEDISADLRNLSVIRLAEGGKVIVDELQIIGTSAGRFSEANQLLIDETLSRLLQSEDVSLQAAVFNELYKRARRWESDTTAKRLLSSTREARPFLIDKINTDSHFAFLLLGDVHILQDKTLTPSQRKTVEQYILSIPNLYPYLRDSDDLYNNLSTESLLVILLRQGMYWKEKLRILIVLSTRKIDASAIVPVIRKEWKDCVDNVKSLDKYLEGLFDTLAKLGTPEAVAIILEGVRDKNIDVNYAARKAIAENNLRMSDQNKDLFNNLIMELEKGNSALALKRLKQGNPEFLKNIWPFEEDVDSDAIYAYYKLPVELRPYAANKMMIEALTKAILATNVDDFYQATKAEEVSLSMGLFGALFLAALRKDSQGELGDKRRELLLRLLSQFAKKEAPTLYTFGHQSWMKEHFREFEEEASKEEFNAFLIKLSSREFSLVKELILNNPGEFTFEQLSIFLSESGLHKLMTEENGVTLQLWNAAVISRDALRARLRKIMASAFAGKEEDIMPEYLMSLPGSRIILAIDQGGTIIGFIHYRSSGGIDELAVIPERPKDGLGTRLLMAATYDLARIGYKGTVFNITLGAEDFYIKFAERYGYQLSIGDRDIGMHGSPSRLEYPESLVNVGISIRKGSDVIDNAISLPAMQKIETGGIVDSVSSPTIDKELGGIAFNALPIQTESVASSALGSFSGSKAFQGDLDAEWAQIQTVFNAGIRPSIQRISEYTAAAVSSGLAGEKTDQVRAMLADILRRDEEDEKLRLSEATLKKLLSELESGNPVSELKIALVQPKN